MEIALPTESAGVEVHEGGCLCGAVRYRASGRPRYQAACHCRFCQHITGSGFLVEAVFLKENVSFTRGTPKVYAYKSPAHGRTMHPQFCPECGVTVGLTMERFPQVQAIFGGTFDEPGWFAMEKHIFTNQALPWMGYSENMDIFEGHSMKLDGSPEEPSRKSLA